MSGLDTSARRDEVSVVIPTIGRATLARTLRSIAAQTHLPDQVVVAKNGDFELQADVMQILASLRSRGQQVVVLHNGPVDVQRGRNLGLAQVTGEFVTYLDDDDEFSPQRIERFRAQWTDEAAFLYTDETRVTPSGRISVFRRRETVNAHDIALENYVGNQVFTRSQRLREVGGYDEALSAAQDYDLWIRLIHRFGAARRSLGGEQLIHWSGDSISANRSKRSRGYLKVYFKHRRKVNLSKAERAWKIHYLRFHLGRPLWLRTYIQLMTGRLPVQTRVDATWFMYSRLRERWRRGSGFLGRSQAL
jgi:glycosyltransferase involved in cell wall biosynthesis